jgi:hypothetical protein
MQGRGIPTSSTLPTFFNLRFRDALAVLRGQAVAVYLYDGSETGPKIPR